MNELTQNAYRRLEKNVIDTVHEWQVKLGYAEEMIHIYYNRDSLEQLVGLSLPTVEEAKAFLIQWREAIEGRFGQVKLSNKGERFCVGIPAQGTRYVHECKKDNTFLLELMEVIKKPACTIDDVMVVFKKQKPEVICEKANGDEFDYVIYYPDYEEDPYRYCFSFGQMGAFYHRFTPYDYQTIL
ncbi:DUF3877 family protein [Anaerosporobacter faecicola]|uniref:DUF3877 family protein n=1 Tax=Anaerosporobacter faecicola TaxID=2718714 RepID=UPI0014394799|nr:DUF3877 family protein [Anaerosporobacter faecicola]